MNLNIFINLEDTFPISVLTADLQNFSFVSPQMDGSSVTIHVAIQQPGNKFIPNVYNLAFGPLKPDGNIDDVTKLKHVNPSKVYSTIILGALTFLNNNKDLSVGIDGSNKVRAYLYYKLIQLNYDYLAQFFKLIGVKYYIRLLRGVNITDPYVTDIQDLANLPLPIIKGENIDCVSSPVVRSIKSYKDFLTLMSNYEKDKVHRNTNCQGYYRA
jgi:hypothetical protein